MSKPPGRPKSEDPKVAVTLRLKASVLARYKSEGDDWRARIEAAVERLTLAEREALLRGDWADPVEINRAAPAVHVDAPVLKRKAFNPQPKPGKAKR